MLQISDCFSTHQVTPPTAEQQPDSKIAAASWHDSPVAMYPPTTTTRHPSSGRPSGFLPTTPHHSPIYRNTSSPEGSSEDSHQRDDEGGGGGNYYNTPSPCYADPSMTRATTSAMTPVSSTAQLLSSPAHMPYFSAQTPGPSRGAKYTLIANVPYDTVRQDLVLEFRKYGRVELAMVVCDEASRHPHKEWTSTAGYAFVRFSQRSEAAAAIQAASLGLIVIRGTRVRADWARKDSYAKRGRVSPTQGAPLLGPTGVPDGIAQLQQSLLEHQQLGPALRSESPRTYLPPNCFNPQGGQRHIDPEDLIYGSHSSYGGSYTTTANISHHSDSQQKMIQALQRAISNAADLPPLSPETNDPLNFGGPTCQLHRADLSGIRLADKTDSTRASESFLVNQYPSENRFGSPISSEGTASRQIHAFASDQDPYNAPVLPLCRLTSPVASRQAPESPNSQGGRKATDLAVGTSIKFDDVLSPNSRVLLQQALIDVIDGTFDEIASPVNHGGHSDLTRSTACSSRSHHIPTGGKFSFPDDGSPNPHELLQQTMKQLLPLELTAEERSTILHAVCEAEESPVDEIPLPSHDSQIIPTPGESIGSDSA